jgi:hypothetical protein
MLRAIAEAASHDADVEDVYRGMVQGFVDATAARIRRDAAAGRTSLAHPDHVAAALVWMTERHLADTFGRVGATGPPTARPPWRPVHHLDAHPVRPRPDPGG